MSSSDAARNSSGGIGRSSGSSSVQERPSAASPRRGTGCPRLLGEAERLRADRAPCELDRRRAEPRTCSGATGRPWQCSAVLRGRDPPAPVRVSETSSQPISGARAGPTAPPAARASICAPRQTPKHGNLGGEHVAEKLFLALEPGEAIVLVGMHRAAEDHHRVVARRRGRASAPSGTDHRSSACPPASTASSNTPPGTVGPWVTESTRIRATVECGWLRTLVRGGIADSCRWSRSAPHQVARR